MGAAAPTLDTHEWISFDDTSERRTWMIDATFMRSNWSCIYGAGCQGVLDADATEMAQGCCSYGAHFVDDDDLAETTAFVERLTDDTWQFRRRARRSGWHTEGADGVVVTRLVDGACIFLNRPGFERGTGCALHVGAEDAGEHFLDWKPEVCWQLPLRLTYHDDEVGHTTHTLREWKRRDWGEGGLEFHWWCTDAPDAFVADEPVVLSQRDEIVAMVGAAVYERLLEHLDLEHRPRETWLPHPSRRRTNAQA